MINKDLLFERYLNLLRIKPSGPTIDLLSKIVKAHLLKVPFENISKLLYKKQGMKEIPELGIWLDGIEKYNFGGTCYSNNYYLYLLLKYIGFDVKLCGADMKNPDVHLISIVKIDGNEYIIDGGYAAPFFEPLPRDLTDDYTISLGKEKYLVKPKDENGRTRVEQYYNDELQHWYTAKPQSRNIGEFQKVVEDSYADDATFMNALRITRFSENGSLVLKNLQLIETIRNKIKFSKYHLNDIPSLVERRFRIPGKIAKEAIACLGELKDMYD